MTDELKQHPPPAPRARASALLKRASTALVPVKRATGIVVSAVKTELVLFGRTVEMIARPFLVVIATIQIGLIRFLADSIDEAETRQVFRSYRNGSIKPPSSQGRIGHQSQGRIGHDRPGAISGPGRVSGMITHDKNAR